MLRFESTLLRHLRQRGDAPTGARVLVAVSGGGDSVALLAALVALAPSLELTLAVAHADHGLRPASSEDAAFVRDLCRHWDLDLVEGSLGVKAHAAQSHLGVETAARELRWAWLDSEARSWGALHVATGHTLDDHTETVFLRLQRGGGLRCLTPLAPVQNLRWSPLVHLRRDALRDYLRAKGLPWREDETNQEPFTPRNRLRPLLAELRREVPELDRNLLVTHLQIEEALLLAEARIEGWRGTRWDLADSGLDLDSGPWSVTELSWILARAAELLAWPKEAAALRELASWLHLRLSRPRPGNNGAYQLHPSGSRWRLTRGSQKPVG